MRRPITAFTAVVLTSASLLAPAGAIDARAARAAETCQGEAATIVGAGAAITGTSGRDVIVTGTSTDVEAGDGNDLICVSSPDLAIRVDAGAGDDEVDAGEVSVSGQADVQMIDGGVGDDLLAVRATQNGASYLVDLAAGTATRNGVPAMRPTAFEDLSMIAGEFVFDVAVSGTDAANHVEVAGWTPRAQVSLGAGDDTATLSQVEWASGPHAIDLGPGTDHLIYHAREQAVALDLSAGTLRSTPVGVGSAVGVEAADVIAYSATLEGTSAGDDLTGIGCSIRVVGRGGNDRLLADRYDFLTKESFICDGEATILGGAGSDHITGHNDADTAKGGTGTDQIDGRGGRDTIWGQGGKDRLTGGARSDVLLGGSGRDTTDGGKGRDRCVAEREKRCER